MAGLFIFLIYAVVQYKKPYFRNKERTTETSDVSNDGTGHLSPNINSLNRNSLAVSTAPRSQAVSITTIKTKVRLTKRFHFSFVFIFFYTLCTLPLVFVVYLETYYYMKITKKTLNTIVGTGFFIYSALSPIIIMIYMPCLKASMRLMLNKFKSCCKCAN